MKIKAEKRLIFFSIFIVIVFIFIFLVFFTNFSITGNWINGGSISYLNGVLVKVIFTFIVIIATLAICFMLFKEMSKITYGKKR
jgi:hypothetical protein